MDRDIMLNIHAVLCSSLVNGPGERLVVFFQGCARRCPGCFNPETHPFDEKSLISSRELLAENLTPGVEGITASGGEPFMQPEGLHELLRAAREHSLSTVVYTGFTIEEIRADASRARALLYIDALIDGPFVEGMKEAGRLARGSANQRIHLLSGRYAVEDFELAARAEIIIGRDGLVRETGFGRLSPAAFL